MRKPKDTKLMVDVTGDLSALITQGLLLHAVNSTKGIILDPSEKVLRTETEKGSHT